MSHAWLHRILESAILDAIRQGLGRSSRLILSGSLGSSTSILSGCLALRQDRPILLVVAHLDEADDTLEDLQLFNAAGLPLACERFSALEVLPGESNVSLDLLAQRLGVVARLQELQRTGQGFRGVIVAPIQALMQSVPHSQALNHFQLSLKTGDRLPPGQLLDWLDRAGYQRNEVVEQPGEFATRGGIIDVYPPAGLSSDQTSEDGSVGPLRLDYFGDEIESIRRIDTDTMGSGQALREVRIIGASLEQLQNDDDATHLLSLLPEHTLVVLHEVMELAEQARGYYERLTNARGIYPPDAIFKLLQQQPHLEVNQYSAAARSDTVMPLPLQPLAGFDQDAGKAIQELIGLVNADDAPQVTLLCHNEAERDRLGELLEEHADEDPANVRGRIGLELGYLHRGFVWMGHSSVEVLVPHHELFHRYQTRRRVRRVIAPEASPAGSDAFLDIGPGDHVVHVDHGIARFVGLRTMTRGGKTEEFLTLEFANKALLHVPTTQIDLVQRYVGGFQGKPPLSLLGGKRWAKQKEAAAEAAKDLAAQLLQIQAARASLPGIRYPADTGWQHEFEAEFPFEETADQLAAIAQVKRDMADEQPMDRLICGDVGFGKTEVAMRAAFKAAEFGKQVATLVPTTVLAEQHERTFRERMAAYPFRVESLSRFKSDKEQRELLEAVRAGQVDMIIGTHRLLSSDVKFADLGLVIIDEEQRFGVEHKQKLLQFRLTADVLTLSATPIPRTLHMAMLGLRDISSLATPPVDRRAIVTEVLPYDEKRIQQALIRELSRDGQVFFVHNRVHNIQSVADNLNHLVPEARIIVGHGQMSGHELEQVMLRFVRREADILVCTTIIESGIDIPTANTIFINEADHFGLVDLHQLRGRVGRYKHRAYCYLLLNRNRTLTDAATRRLKAIEQYSMLGAGFKIAMRDLEIRGAGNLLGAEQSGHIAAVGYEMYCTLLDQAAKRLRRETVSEPVRTHLELPLTGRIERQYIPSDKYRMEAYRRLCRATRLEDLEALKRDLTDAYGPPPPGTQTLMDLAELRLAAGALGIDSIKLEKSDLIFITRQPQGLDSLLKDAPGRATMVDSATIYYRPPPKYLESPPTLLAVLRNLLRRRP